MKRATRTFRIFVSSTFSDLKEERNALQERVFPKLRELCTQHGCRFQAIDLRWGVREEAALDQQTMKICLEEIARCQRVTPRPNFIVLLGDRYGWCPLPYEIPAGEFEEILHTLSDAGDKELLTHWYRRDDNAVPPVYDLQPRTGEFVGSPKWEPVERHLRSVLLGAIKGLPLENDKRLKYTASATEQEIVYGALKVEDAREHVFCFFRTIRHLPKDKSGRDYIDLEEDGKPSLEAQQQLADLKGRLRSLLPDKVFDYEAEWKDGGVSTDHIDHLCEDVYNSLSRIILEQIAKIEEVDPLEQEIADHEAFGKDRAKFFTGRAAILRGIANYIKGADRYLLAVFGCFGSGKTALIAKAVEQARNEHPRAVIVHRFIGATPSSSDGRALLESLCRQIYEAFGFEEQKRQKLAKIKDTDAEAHERRRAIEEEYEIPLDFQKLSMTFRDFLTKIPTDNKLILFLDALDQLSNADYTRNLSWLPAGLPEHVRLIVSILPDECLSVLQRKLPETNLAELEPMSLNEGSDLLDLWFKDVGRILQNHQRNEALDKFDRCGLPLYLKLAFEEARRWNSYTEKKELSPDIPGIIRDLFSRLSLDANHGKIIVSRSLGYLASAKNGLTEDELLDVLSLNEEVLQDFIQRAYHEPPEKRLPVVVWSRLYFDLEPYLTERTADGTTLLTFYHDQLGDVVEEEFLVGETKRKRHEELAIYFSRQPLWTEKEVRKNPSVRKVSELPYQQIQGQLWDEIEQTLCDLHFIEAKCGAAMTYDLIADYNAALGALPDAQKEKQKELKRQARIKKYTEDLIAYSRGEIKRLDVIHSVELWSDEKTRKDTERIINNPTRLDRVRTFSLFVNSESPNLVTFGRLPGFVIQQAYNSADSGPVARSAESILNTEVDGVILLEYPSQRADFNPHPSLLMKVKHKGGFGILSITPDGKRAISINHYLTRDNVLRVWDLENGQCINTLEVSEYWVNAACITADGKVAISSGDNHTLKVWDLEGGRCIKTLEGHSDGVFALSITPDGRKALSASWDKSIMAWDLENGECLQTFTLHPTQVNDLTIAANGNIGILGCDDNTIRVWDLESGESSKELEGHTDSVTCVNVTPDGKRALSVSRDRTVRLWDLGSGERIKTLEAHKHGVSAGKITPDGSRAISGSYDKTLKIWDLESGKCLRTLKGHTHSVLCVCVTVDGSRAVSGSYDKTLKIWDLGTGKCLRTLKGHTDYVLGLSVTLDGRSAVSRSENNDYGMRVWDLESGECMRRLEGHKWDVTCVSVTPDGRRAVSGSRDNTLRMWDLRSGACLRKLDGHADWVNTVSVTLDGKKAFSGSDDYTIRVWELESGECIAFYEAKSKVTSVSEIRPSGHLLYGKLIGETLGFLRCNVPMGPPLVTAVRIWLYGKNGNKGRWEDDIKAKCHWCGQRFPVKVDTLDVIAAITRDANLSPEQSPCLELPDEAWDEPRLLSECPSCNQPLKFNPFIVDNRDRY